MGIYVGARHKLASPDLAIPHGGRAALRDAPGMAPSHEFALPPCEYLLLFLCPPPDDRGPMAERLCCRPLRPAPASRGVCCLGGRKKGRALHLLLDAHHVGYLSYTARPGIVRYLSVLLCFALGLMAKPMLVTLPFVLLLLDYWPLRRLELRKQPRETLNPPPQGAQKRKEKGRRRPQMPRPGRQSPDGR